MFVGSNALARGETTVQRALPASIARSVSQVEQAREDAARRSDRSKRTAKPTADAADLAAAHRARAAADQERAAWAAEHSQEIRSIERTAAGASGRQTMERSIEWTLPVRKFRLSAGYGRAGSMWSHLHTGLDFASPLGTPVYAVGDGEIIGAGWESAYSAFGNRIQVRHEDGTVTWYCHLSRIALRSGPVRAGTLIGYVGSTGNSSGPHLHFEVHPAGGTAIDPMPWLRQKGLL
ncbi:M23 family metallopeptidase [Actinopolymorpha cephalotaxi]|uniref:Murein DD-endopeptidase MepM/ murein hydrolase activator NlpD n=1 Tax=Actinopolymorpha cephalotaxi TaxID=504797 RepID=A0ABX2S5S4_9ACTN|nr:M23 family metallopeptidase [Actinopolymorpha cephalotaxi]NYH84664.1 murein DD-endopeptidase MepM/ murein hydrolase activator NlpD [Actinopolymorpha cephalotaxi]